MVSHHIGLAHRIFINIENHSRNIEQKLLSLVIVSERDLHHSSEYLRGYPTAPIIHRGCVLSVFPRRGGGPSSLFRRGFCGHRGVVSSNSPSPFRHILGNGLVAHGLIASAIV